MTRATPGKPLTVMLIIFIACAVTFNSGLVLAESAEPESGFDEQGIEQGPGYIIGAEDVLDISVWKNADLSRIVTVRPDGKISLPLIGDVQAAGLTPESLRDTIVTSLREYQDSLVASVIVTEANSHKIFILGEVAAPGSYVMRRRTTILQAIAMAGGLNQYASKNNIVVVRERTGTETKEEKISIRFKDLIKGKKDKNLVLRSGDTIFVP